MTGSPDPTPVPGQSPRRRRSRAVKLTLVGGTGSLAALLAGCSGGNQTWHRNVYKSLDDCASDYSRVICASDGQAQRAAFLGPVYRMVNGRPSACRSSDRGAGPAWNSRRTGVESVVRGGFGTSCPSRGRWWSSSGGG